MMHDILTVGDITTSMILKLIAIHYLINVIRNQMRKD